MNLTIGEIATILGIFIGMVSAITVVLEFKTQGTQKRAEFFSRKLDELWKNDLYKHIWLCLDTHNEEEIRHIPREDKLSYLVIFDEIALMMNSGLIKKDVAYYMFGYFAITCWENDAFWEDPGIDRRRVYWSVLKNFVADMKVVDQDFKYNKKRMKF